MTIFAGVGFDGFMAGSGWAWFSLISAVFSAGFYLVNQYWRMPGDLLVFTMRIMIVALMTPFVHTLDWPDNPLFYAVVAITVAVGTSSDVRTFNASARFGAGMVSRLMPVTVLVAFFLWFAVRPALLFEYLARPWLTLGVLLSLASCVYFAMRLNRCEVSRSAMVFMAPALAGYTITTVLNKYAMDFGAGAADFSGVVLGYMYVQSLIALVMVGPYILWQRRRRFSPLVQTLPVVAPPPSLQLRPLLAASFAAALVWLAHMVFKNYAMAYAENPSYQAAIGLTAPVMIALVYRSVGHREETDVRAGMGIVAAALLLVIVTAFK
ncbi:MAG: hypothetical protein Q8K65_05490 [Alphaproteobacteria bacterium]|nr:hypothetical protein [Alphaproteobacteria bacterium]